MIFYHHYRFCIDFELYTGDRIHQEGGNGTYGRTNGRTKKRENHPKVEDPEEAYETQNDVVQRAIDVVEMQQSVTPEPQNARRVLAELHVRHLIVVRLAPVSFDVVFGGRLEFFDEQHGDDADREQAKGGRG